MLVKELPADLHRARVVVSDAQKTARAAHEHPGQWVVYGVSDGAHARRIALEKVRRVVRAKTSAFAPAASFEAQAREVEEGRYRGVLPLRGGRAMSPATIHIDVPKNLLLKANGGQGQVYANAQRAKHLRHTGATIGRDWINQHQPWRPYNPSGGTGSTNTSHGGHTTMWTSNTRSTTRGNPPAPTRTTSHPPSNIWSTA